MLYAFLRWVGMALAIVFISWVVPGIKVDNFIAAMIVAVIISLINIFIKPVLLFITLPINILTLGLFILVINALLFMFAAYIAPGFEVDGFWSALVGSILFSILSIGINMI